MLCHVGLENPASTFKSDRRSYGPDKGSYTYSAHNVVIVCKVRFAGFTPKDLVGIEIHIV